MSNEINGIIKNILRTDGREIEGISHKLSTYFDWYCSRNINRVAKNLKYQVNLEIEDIIRLASKIVFNSDFYLKKKSSFDLKFEILSVEDEESRINYKDFVNLEELSCWLKTLFDNEIFEKVNLSLRNETFDQDFLQRLIDEYDKKEILPFKLPIEYYKLLLETHDHCSIKVITLIRSLFPEIEKNECEYFKSKTISKVINNNSTNINCDNFIMNNEPSKNINLDRKISTYTPLKNNVEYNKLTFSQKVEKEQIRWSKIMNIKKSELKYNDVIKISYSLKNLLNDDHNLMTLEELYSTFASSNYIVNRDEISFCINSHDTDYNKDINQTNFCQFLRDHFEAMIIANKFLLVKVLHKSSFGHIYLAVDILLYKFCCIKKFKGDFCDTNYFKNALVEASTIKMLNNSSISKFIPEYMDIILANKSLFLVTELLGDNLLTLINKFNDKATGNRFFTFGKIQRIAHQLLTCLEHLHETCGLIHCDIKPENIVLDSIDSFDLFGYLKNNKIDSSTLLNIKLIDWGNCINIFQASTSQNSYLQSRYYRSPEICLGLPYSEKIDLWSTGCIIAELFLGKPLFGFAKTTQHLLANIVSILGKIPTNMIRNSTIIDHFLTPDGHLFERQPNNKFRIYTILNEKPSRKRRLDEIIDIPDNPFFLDLIKSLLCIDPKERISASQALKHPWFKCYYSDGI